MKTASPLLSIVTVNLNNSEGLEKTLKSIFEQTWQNFELIVIDGGSKDGSKEHLEKHESQMAYWVSEKDEGIYNGMNKGLRKCKGNYVVFMNSGDYFLSPDSLKLCFEIISYNDADIFYGQIKIDDEGSEKTITYPSKLSLNYLKKRVINHQACFFKIETMLNLGGYNEKYHLAADYHYYLIAYLKGKTFHPILIPIVKYDISGISTMRMENYRAEMNKAWDDTVPVILFDLEVKYLNLLATIKSSLILRVAFKIREYKIKIFHGK